MIAFHPGRVQIDGYGNGGFRFGGMSHRGSILILPSGIRGWRPASTAEITRGDLDPLLAERDGIDMLILGTGAAIIFPPANIRRTFDDAHLGYEAMTTGAAVRTYNILLAEDRRVAAGLIAVDRHE